MLVASPNPAFNEIILALTGITPDPGGTPVVQSRSPNHVPHGSPELLLTINGSSFVPGAGVHWNGVPRPAMFVSSRKLRVWLTAADLATAGAQTFRVANPSGPMSWTVAFVVD